MKLLAVILRMVIYLYDGIPTHELMNDSQISLLHEILSYTQYSNLSHTQYIMMLMEVYEILQVHDIHMTLVEI